jgi:hypothetical protein
MKVTKESDARLHHEIEDAITFLLLCDAGFGVGDMEFFDGALLGYESVFKSITAVCDKDNKGDQWRLANDVPKIGGAMLMGGEKAGTGTRMVAAGARELDWRAKQKLASRSIGRMSITLGDAETKFGYDKLDPHSRIVEVRAVEIQESGAARSLCKNHFVRGRKYKGGATRGWYTIGPNHRFGGPKEQLEYDSLCFGIGTCSASVSRLWWRVLVRFGGQRPGIQLYTDATGVKDFFRFREIPEGRSRRDALVHWVSDHWRQNRFDPDIENYVREHLRGSREFDWHNLAGTIELPEPEIEREQTAIVHRKRLRRDELDRRVRMWRRGQ